MPAGRKMKTIKISSKKSIYLIDLHPYCENSSFFWARVNLFFRLNGYKLSPDAKGAAVLILTGCAVVDPIIEKSREVISKLLKTFPGKTIVLFGCIAPLLNFKQNGRLITINSKDLDRFSLLFESRIPISECGAGLLSEGFCRHPLGSSEKDKFVNISQGCSNNCSYCNIKLSKGGVKSVPAARIKADVKKLAAGGAREITLLADDCGSYGHDINTNIAELFQELPKTGYAGRQLKYKIHYMFPEFLIRYYPQLKPAFLDHRITDINVPLQSGAPRVLKLMNREYDLRELSSILREIRKNNPKIRIISSFMINFPGETMAEFRQSLYYARLFNFALFLAYCDNKRTSVSRLGPKCTDKDLEQKTREVKAAIKKKTIRGILVTQPGLPDEFPDSLPLSETEGR